MAHLTSANLTKAGLIGTRLADADLTSADLTDASRTYADFFRTAFSPTNLSSGVRPHLPVPKGSVRDPVMDTLGLAAVCSQSGHDTPAAIETRNGSRSRPAPPAAARGPQR
jgi:hypothetical protein